MDLDLIPGHDHEVLRIVATYLKATGHTELMQLLPTA